MFKDPPTIEELRKLPANRKCFDCGDKGVTYIITKHGIFVCSACAGIHREIGFRAMGISMSVFKDEDLKHLAQWGNEKAKEYWMADYDKTLFPVPDKKDAIQLKMFLK